MSRGGLKLEAALKQAGLKLKAPVLKAILAGIGERDDAVDGDARADRWHLLLHQPRPQRLEARPHQLVNPLLRRLIEPTALLAAAPLSAL